MNADDDAREDPLARSIESMLRALGEDPTEPRLARTPQRVAALLRESVDGRTRDPLAPLARTTPAPDGAGLVTLARARFRSRCEHHLETFVGFATIAYVPTDRLAGLSRLAEVLEILAHRLQSQERLAAEIAGALEDRLAPTGVGVLLEATHACMAFDEARQPDAPMATEHWTGSFRIDPGLREVVRRLHRTPETSPPTEV